jgi:hypothetical protein
MDFHTDDKDLVPRSTVTQCCVPVFQERFLLPVCAAALVAVALVNPMQFDVKQRIYLGTALLFFAAFLAHTIQKTSTQPEPGPSGLSSGPQLAVNTAPREEQKPQTAQEAKAPDESKARTLGPKPVTTFPSNEQVERVRSRIRYLVAYSGTKVLGLYEVFGPIGDNVLDAPQMFDQRGVIKYLASMGEIKIVQETPNNIVFEVQEKLVK